MFNDKVFNVINTCQSLSLLTTEKKRFKKLITYSIISRNLFSKIMYDSYLESDKNTCK